MKVKHLKQAIEEALASGDIREDQSIEFALPIVLRAATRLEEKEEVRRRISEMEQKKQETTQP